MMPTSSFVTFDENLIDTNHSISNINAKNMRALRKTYMDTKKSCKMSIEQVNNHPTTKVTRASKGKQKGITKEYVPISFSPDATNSGINDMTSLPDVITPPNLPYKIAPLISTTVSITRNQNSDVLNLDVSNSNSKDRRKLRKDYLHNKISKRLSIAETSAQVDNENYISRNPISGVSIDYIDHGDQTVICEACHSKLWKDEAAKGKKRLHNRTSYSVCCGYSKVQLPGFKEPPHAYKELYNGVDPQSKFFLNNIRRYNSMFSFTSMGGKIDRSINKGNAPYIFRLYGQNYHLMGSLLPEDGFQPKFSQLYIYDTENEVSNRQSVVGDSTKASSSESSQHDIQIIEYLKNMLDSENILVRSYRMARDSFINNPQVDLKLRLIGTRKIDGRTYNIPEASEVAALIVGDIGDALDNRDIVVKKQTGQLERINEIHPAYLGLQYPLLFPYGEDGYRVDILHRGVTSSSNNKRQYCTMREFFAYIIQERDGVFSLILNARRLFQQFLVDAYTMIESERLNYIRFQQKKLRCETFENLRNIRNQGNQDISNVGTRVILPSSFTGGARYMMQNYLDAMSLCKWYGYPDFFITITCNSKWPEVARFLQNKNLNSEDRPDILCRLFKMKLDSLVKDLKEHSILGKVSAVVYTVEFQKRGLPHAHICVFMHSDHKFPTVEYIDPIISAEIPDPNEDLELYKLVSDYMIHGPCGGNNPNCPCMVNNRCSKKFPKNFREYTSIDSKGYPLYRRRDDGYCVEKSGVKLDNRSVIPYNKTLLKRYQAHINVEWCNQGGSIKYLFKYINKGPDRVTATVSDANSEEADEIKEYYDCRYISACEATWRILAYDVHYRYPSVIRLPFHLPNQQSVVYGADDFVDSVLSKPSVASTMFLSWMECNECNSDARNLTYVEFPTRFVFKADQRCWAPRKKGFSIGRIHAVSPAMGEAYYLRMLLNKVKGPKSFEDIRTVNGIIFPTFKEACFSLELLDDDKEYVEAIEEASHAGSGYYLRRLFVMMLTSNCMSRPEHVWEKTWQILSEDIVYRQQLILDSPDLSLSEAQIKSLTLFDIEKILIRNNSTLRNWSTMPYPDQEAISLANNRFITEELNYDRESLLNDFNSLYTALNDEQMCVYNEIIKVVTEKNGGVFFVYGYGGTGKTFLWKTLSASLRSKGEIVLNVASSGIASLLLSGGRTAHSRFHIPINLNEDSMCYIKPNTDVADLLKKTSLIIWDEAPMTHRHAFEALDRTLKDVFTCDGFSNSEKLFGGKTVVFGGDFRQILPVIQSGSRQDIVNASLSSSYIWHDCKVLRLTKNMRLFVGTDVHDVEQTKNFAQWLLDLGEGKIGGSNDGDATIDIPEDLLIMESADPISDLFEFVYPSLIHNFNNSTYLQERAILAPTNEVVDEINERFLSFFPGHEKEYLSSDSICGSEHLQDGFDQSLYSPDVLNGLKISGMPNHKLVLKVGVPVMLLRNIDHKSGLCNGTRLKIISLGNRVIEAEIISGSNIGGRTFIPRIGLTPSEKNIPFKFQRRQFPLAVCFAMTINKSQGQSLSKVGLFLKQSVFSHGQLYVAMSRVKRKDGLKLLILDQDGNVTNRTSNVVYKEIFRNL